MTGHDIDPHVIAYQQHASKVSAGLVEYVSHHHPLDISQPRESEDAARSIAWGTLGQLLIYIKPVVRGLISHRVGSDVGMHRSQFFRVYPALWRNVVVVSDVFIVSVPGTPRNTARLLVPLAKTPLGPCCSRIARLGTVALHLGH